MNGWIWSFLEGGTVNHLMQSTPNGWVSACWKAQLRADITTRTLPPERIDIEKCKMCTRSWRVKQGSKDI